MSDAHVPFVNNLAGAFANAEMPDMGPALKAVKEMDDESVGADVESPDFESLDEVVNGVEEAMARRKQREAEKKKKKREAEKQSKERSAEVARTQRRKPKHRFVPSNPSTEPAPEGPVMGL